MPTIEDTGAVLIAGGAGYIGSHVNRVLAGQGRATVAYDNLSRGHRAFLRWGEFEEGDLGDTGRLREVFRKHRIGSVMHFAAFTYVGESMEDPLAYYDNNVANTVNLLGVMREFGARDFIFSSTAAIFGNPDVVPVKEEHPRRPINPYGRSKLMIEDILGDCAAAYGLRSVSLRYFNAAGADPAAEIGEWHEPETHLVPLVLDAAIGARENVQIYGTDYDTPDGTCVRDYIHVMDLAEAHVLALEYLHRGGETNAFNLGNGRGFSVREVIDAARSVTGKEIRAVEAPRRPGDPAVLVADSGKAAKILGWRPRHRDIEEIIETAWAWRRKLASG